MTKTFATLAVIGGTGMDHWPELKIEQEIEVETPYGVPSAPVVVGQFHGVRALFLARHGKAHGIAPHRIDYRANIDALAQCGARTVVAVSAVGSIAPALEPGNVGVPADIIDYTWGRQHTFRAGDPDEGEAGALRHIEFTSPYSERVRCELLHAALARDVDIVDGGVLGVTQGPRLETAAEVRRLKRDGCDMVGMTGMPEAALAAERGLDYACLAVSVNWAAGLGRGDIHGEIAQCVEAGMARVRVILAAALPALQAQQPSLR
ncbi:MAG: S-methyl-5'-thioinosine phosphorylase [Nevskiaceae bacterium]|nr:MAG: S-methyl-5'-thioinosine phosphorylase [Nevskiaceae bacterium]TBR74034.1 MAG: S-methyl-5'-thioinosine phosphorylase [Nevskiaceae bacterium]